jgi:hypothetical protein
MKTRKSDRSWSHHVIQTIGASALTMSLWTTGALAQQVQNGNFTAGTFNGTWSELGVQQPAGTLVPQATGWTVSGGGIDCVMMSSNYTAGVGGTPMCGTAYTGPSTPATLTQSPGPVPGGYVGNILVADAYEGAGGPPKTGGFTEAISQTIGTLTPSTAYSLSFYYSGAQQSGFSGDSADFWQVSYGPTTGTNTIATTPICIPDAGGAGTGLCAGINSGTPGPVWAKQTFNFTTTASGAGSTSEFISFLAQGNATANGPPFMLLANVSLSKAPEPASLALFGVGLAGLIGLRRRARSAA